MQKPSENTLLQTYEPSNKMLFEEA